MIPLRPLALVVTVFLGACASNSYCEGEQGYETAPSVPELKPVDGMVLPQSGSALRVPPPPANPVPYGEPVKDADGDDAVRCLDRPPEMPPPKPEVEPLAPPPAAAPAPSAPPVPEAKPK
jgi:hypothetical protein